VGGWKRAAWPLAPAMVLGAASVQECLSPRDLPDEGTRRTPRTSPQPLQSCCDANKFQPEVAAAGQPAGRANGHRVFQLFGSAENPRAACMRGTSGFPGAGRPTRKSGSRENGGAPSRTREAPADAAKGRVARQGTKGGVVSSVLAESEMSREWLTMAFPTRFAGTLESGTGVPGQPFPRYLEQQRASNAF